MTQIFIKKGAYIDNTAYKPVTIIITDDNGGYLTQVINVEST